MPAIIESLDELANATRVLPHGLIGIDGYHATGKTTLARSLSAALGVPVVHLDTFLHPHQGSFVRSIRLPELSAALRQRPVIVEGVCLLAALSLAGVKPDLLIYILGSEPHPMTSGDRSALASEVRDYHRKWQPVDMADAYYFINPAKEAIKMRPIQPDVDVAFIQAKTILAITLAIGGMLALVIGLIVLLYGASTPNQTTFRIAGLDVSASGIGGVIMATSAIWAFFSYQCRPVYSRLQQSSQKYPTPTGMVELTQHFSSTASTVEPMRDRKLPPDPSANL